VFILLYYLHFIDFYRYFYLTNIQDISSLDSKYITIPKVQCDRRVVISLTTIPSRIGKLKSTLASLLTQCQRIDEIYINIPQNSNYEIPQWLSELKNVRINWCDRDYGPSTKLLPSLLKEDKKTIIIVVDDDVIYGSKMVETYIGTFYERRCKDAITIYGSFINSNLEIVNDFPSFMRFDRVNYRHHIDLLTGNSSFLVTPEMLPSNIFDYDIAPKECVWVDDIWISGWLAVNKVNIYSIGSSFRNIPLANLNNRNNALCKTRNLSRSNEKVTISWFYNKMKICHKKRKHK
jgi:hypothetical protein